MLGACFGTVVQPRSADPESGSTLAAVVGIVAVTGITALALLASVAFGAGFTSATRAGVEARAAAEGGIDYALANVVLCDPTTRTVSTRRGVPSTPASADVTVEYVEYRLDPRGDWIVGASQTADKACPPTNAVAIRVVSTGRAETAGAAGHSRGDVRRMEAVAHAEFPHAIYGEGLVDVGAGTSRIADSTLAPASVYSNGAFKCTGNFQMRGPVFSRPDLRTTSGCAHANFQPGSGSSYPFFTEADARWPATTRTHLESTVNKCSLISTSLALERSRITLGAPCGDAGATLKNATLVLKGDVAIFARAFDIANLRVESAPGDTRVHSLYLIRPWPDVAVTASDRRCSSPAPVNVKVSGLTAGPKIKVMVYSSTGVDLVAPTSSSETFAATNSQVYACAVTTGNNVSMSFAPVGRMVVVSKRDLTG